MTGSVAGKVAVVTGANAGLGFALSLSLARMGAHVVMACRNPQRAERATTRLLTEVPGALVTSLPLDVSEPDSIARFAQLLAARVDAVDMLIHNAGIFGVPLTRNSMGHELHFATNYLGPFALTGALLPLIRDLPSARIVNVGSLAHRIAKLDLAQRYEHQGDYAAFWAYGRSKLALLVYTMELDRRLRAHGSEIIALAAHPGMAPTDIAGNHAIANPRSALGKLVRQRIEAWLPSVVEAATPILHAACAKEVKGGAYYGPGGPFEIAGPPSIARVNARAMDQTLATQLWSTSERLTGMCYLPSDGSP